MKEMNEWIFWVNSISKSCGKLAQSMRSLEIKMPI